MPSLPIPRQFKIYSIPQTALLKIGNSFKTVCGERLHFRGSIIDETKTVISNRITSLETSIARMEARLKIKRKSISPTAIHNARPVEHRSVTGQSDQFIIQ